MANYCTAADLTAQFGTVNINKWADLNNNRVTAEMDARVALACQMASAVVDGYLRGGRYSLPFSPVPDVIKNITVMLAAVWLYEGRGVEDYDPDSGQPFHRLAFVRRDAMNQLKMIRAGALRLDVAEAARTVPQVFPVADAGNETLKDQYAITAETILNAADEENH